jgi:hypothetical protein
VVVPVDGPGRRGLVGAVESRRPFAGFPRACGGRCGVGINEAANGAFLPGSKAAATGLSAVPHAPLHTTAYYTTVNQMLAQATSRPEVIEVLATIRTALIAGRFP